MPASVTVNFPEWVKSFDAEKRVVEIDSDKAYTFWLNELKQHYTAIVEQCATSEKVKNRVESDSVLKFCCCPEVMAGCCPETPNQYWLEVANLCCRLEAFRLCQMVTGKWPFRVHFDRGTLLEDGETSKWAQKAAPDAGAEALAQIEAKHNERMASNPKMKPFNGPKKGGQMSLGTFMASKGLHARQHYENLKGRAVAATVIKPTS